MPASPFLRTPNPSIYDLTTSPAGFICYCLLGMHGDQTWGPLPLRPHGMPLEPSNTRSTGTQGMTVLTSALPRDFNQPEPGLCQPCPNSRLHSPLLKPLHEHVCTLSLKFPQFCCLGKHCFGNDPCCSPYLLQVINTSVFWLQTQQVVNPLWG